MRTFVAAGILGLAMAGMGSASVAGIAGWWFVGEDHDGNIVSFRHDGPFDHQTTCGGLAPTVTSCDNGVHTPANGPQSYLHGFDFAVVPLANGLYVGDYMGSVVSQISDGVDTRVFTCNALGGQVPPVGAPSVFGVFACSGVGIKPSGTFRQLCFSNNPGNQLASTGPGGAGDWLCQVLGNGIYPAP